MVSSLPAPRSRLDEAAVHEDGAARVDGEAEHAPILLCAEALGPDGVPVVVELGEVESARVVGHGARLAGDRPGAEVDRVVDLAGDDEAAGRVDGNGVGELVFGSAEALGPDDVAVVVDLGDGDVQPPALCSLPEGSARSP